MAGSKNSISYGTKYVLSNTKHFYCSCHETLLSYKTTITPVISGFHRSRMLSPSYCYMNLPVSVSAVLPTIVPESDENDVVSRFIWSPLYGSASRNLRVLRETKELPSAGGIGCGFRCCRALWRYVNSCCGVWPYVSIMVFNAFWRTGSVIAFTSTP